MKTILESLIGKKVSVLVDNNGTNDHYSGIVEQMVDDVVTLDLNNPSFFIKKIHLKCHLVVSVWELQETAADEKAKNQMRINAALAKIREQN